MNRPYDHLTGLEGGPIAIVEALKEPTAITNHHQSNQCLISVNGQLFKPTGRMSAGSARGRWSLQGYIYTNDVDRPLRIRKISRHNS